MLIPGIAMGSVLLPPDQVSGSVRDTNGIAVVGADVALESGDTGEVAYTVTNGSGSYTFTGVAPGTYYLSAVKDGLVSPLPDTLVIDGIAAGPFRNIRLEIPQITGTVISGGVALEGVSVMLFTRPTSLDPWESIDTAYTDADGFYRFAGFNSGEYTVGYVSQGSLGGVWYDSRYFDAATDLDGADPLNVIKGAATTTGIDLDLAPSPPTMTGRVTNGTGAGLAGVQVTTYAYIAGTWESMPGTNTASDGTYEIYGLEGGPYRVGTRLWTSGPTLWAPAFYVAGGPSAAAVDAGSDVNPTTGSTLSGLDIVVNGTHESMLTDAYEADNSMAQAKPILTNGVIRKHTLFAAPDADWVSFTVTAGHTYTIECTTSVDFPFASLNTDTWLFLYDSNGSTVLAQNDDADRTDAPLLSQIVWTAPSTKTVYARVTDYDSVQGDPSTIGAYGFRVVDQGASAYTGQISGHVTDVDTDAAISGIDVDLKLPSGDWISTATDGEGYYVFAGLELGSYRVSTYKGSYESSSADIAIVDEAVPLTQDLLLTAVANPEPSTLVGQALCNGLPLQGVLVTATRGGTLETSTTLTGADGTYSLRGLVPGSWAVTFSKAGYADVKYSAIDLIPSRATGQNTGMVVALGAVSGTASASGVGALPGVSVSIDGTLRTSTASDGIYSVAGLAIGTHTIAFSKPGYNDYSQPFSVTNGGNTLVSPTLSAVPVPVTTPNVTRSPSKSSLSYKRKKGKAKYTLSATERDISGAALSGRLVYLQTSKNGRSWKNSYQMMTDASGKASKTFTAKKKATVYYRWFVPATSTHNAVTLSKQKVVVK